MSNNSINNLPKSAKFGIGVVIFIVIIIILSGIFRGLFFTFVDGHEIGYKFDRSTGEITVLDRTGYFWVTPYFTAIYTIDGRPMQVRIEANNRVLNAKLVRFRKTPEAVKQFIQMHGLKDYDVLNKTTGTTTGSLADILKSYAYENISNGAYMSDEDIKKALEKKYLFLEILSTGTNTAQPITSTKDSTNTGVVK
jgi:hypothetical protein